MQPFALSNFLKTDGPEEEESKLADPQGFPNQHTDTQKELAATPNLTDSSHKKDTQSHR